jgi:hypothetical protein
MGARSGAKPAGHNADTVRLASTDSRYRQLPFHVEPSPRVQTEVEVAAVEPAHTVWVDVAGIGR